MKNTQFPFFFMNENEKMKKKHKLAVHWEKNSDEWETPIALFNKLDEEFHFTLDPCATHDNHKCAKYYTMDDDGLSKSWKGERVFVNPPYSKVSDWIKKAWLEHHENRVLSVFLIPARTETPWWHACCMNAEVRFIAGRVSFENTRLKVTYSAPFPSVLVIFSGKQGFSSYYATEKRKMLDTKFRSNLNRKSF